MAKTYIYGPSECELRDAGRGEFSLIFETSLYTELQANKDKSLFISVNDSTGPIDINESGGSTTGSATINGWDIDNIGGVNAIVNPIEDAEITPGTYTVSIYYESESGSSTGLPDMNIVHEHKETAKNDIEDIIKAIYESIDETEVPTNGHSPMDRLVVAVAKLLQVDPVKALTQGDYPNQMKRIAAIIRGDFGSGES